MPFMSSYDSLLTTYLAMREATYIKTVELGNAILRNKLGDARVAFGHPSEELWDTHGCCGCLGIASLKMRQCRDRKKSKWRGVFAKANDVWE